MHVLNWFLSWLNLEFLSGDQATTRYGVEPHRYPGGFTPNGSIHTFRPASLFGRPFVIHRRIAIPAEKCGVERNGKIRAGNFRFKSVAEAEAALDAARLNITVNDKGAFVALDVPVFHREHPTDNLPPEVLIAPPRGESLTVHL